LQERNVVQETLKKMLTQKDNETTTLIVPRNQTAITHKVNELENKTCVIT